jgi:hypothetical protein
VRAALACATALTLAACSEEPPFDVASQIGPNPNLTPLQQYLFPPMHLARVVGWKEGEKPTVADGLKIEALATGGAGFFCADIEPWLFASACAIRADLNTSPSIRRSSRASALPLRAWCAARRAAAARSRVGPRTTG